MPKLNLDQESKKLALARKWRPKTFAQLVGQQTVVNVLQNTLFSNRSHHAYLLTGTRGVGKTTIARIIAKSLNCLNLTNNEPCTTCQNCISIDNGRYVDVIEIDAASNTGVDNIRELIDNAQYAPTEGEHKVYIIDEVHMLSKSAFNAMLKTLEEPPEHIIFILATTDPQKIPVTVLSRCLQLKLRHLTIAEIQKQLTFILNQEKVAYEDKALLLIAEASYGSMRDALSLTDQAMALSYVSETIVREMLGLSDENIVFELLDNIINLNPNNVTTIASNAFYNGQDLENILQNLRIQLSNICVSQLTTNHNFSEKIIGYTKLVSINNIQLFFEICNLGLEQIAKTEDKYPIFIMTLLRMVAFNLENTDMQVAVDDTNNNIQHKQNKNIESIDKISEIKSIKHEDVKNIEVTDKIDITKVDKKNKVENIIKTDETPDIDIETSDKAAVDINNVSDTEKIVKIDVTDNIENSVKVADACSNVQQIFDGKWFELLSNLRDKLGHIYPFLANAELLNYNEKELSIQIDKRYESSFNINLIEKFENILAEYFNYKYTIKYTFVAKIDNTLTQKINQDKISKQNKAVLAIDNDSNLSEIVKHFSAIIVPETIKPI